MGARRYAANRRLAWARLQRGWSHDELARQVTRNIVAQDEPPAALTSHTVRRWESGERWPEPRFRKALVRLFGQPASELGLLTEAELALRPEDDELLSAARRLVAMAAGGSGFGRQLFLRGLVGGGLVPALAPLGVSAGAAETLSTPGGNPSRSTAEAFASITAEQRQLYWMTPARPLLESALAHLQLGLQLLPATTEATARATLAPAVTESALLAARVAFFDLQATEVAERCFDVAVDASREAGDHALAAAVLAHRAFIPGFAGDHGAASPLLDSAHAHARHAGGPLLQAWLHCVSAEVSAHVGDPHASLRHARLAADTIDHDTPPPWLDFFDQTRLSGFVGQAHLAAGRYADAIAALSEGKDLVSSDKQRSVLLLDLALAHAELNDADEAAHCAQQALDALEYNWYAISAHRLSQVCTALGDTPYGAELTDRREAVLST